MTITEQDERPTGMSENTAVAVDISSSRFSQAYQDLRNLLIAGHFELNTRLTEAELTRLLDVSRTTVRAVTARLTQEGYLVSEPHRGVRTRAFTLEEAAEILEAREVLDSALAARAATAATDEQLTELARICDAMAEVDHDRDLAHYSGLNRRFHRTVREAAHQATLTGFVDSLHYQLVMRQYRNLARLPRSNSLAEHRAILYALQTRNADAAEATMRLHVASARRALLINAV